MNTVYLDAAHDDDAACLLTHGARRLVRHNGCPLVVRPEDPAVFTMHPRGYAIHRFVENGSGETASCTVAVAAIGSRRRIRTRAAGSSPLCGRP